MAFFYTHEIQSLLAPYIFCVDISTSILYKLIVCIPKDKSTILIHKFKRHGIYWIKDSNSITLTLGQFKTIANYSQVLKHETNEFLYRNLANLQIHVGLKRFILMHIGSSDVHFPICNVKDNILVKTDANLTMKFKEWERFIQLLEALIEKSKIDEILECSHVIECSDCFPYGLDFQYNSY